MAGAADTPARDAFGEMFGEMFGDIFGGGRRGGGRAQVFRGADLKYELELDLNQAVFGHSVGDRRRQAHGVRHLRRQRRGQGPQARSPATPATASARCAFRRASSSCSSRARNAAARAPSSRIPATPVSARVASVAASGSRSRFRPVSTPAIASGSRVKANRDAMAGRRATSTSKCTCASTKSSSATASICRARSPSASRPRCSAAASTCRRSMGTCRSRFPPRPSRDRVFRLRDKGVKPVRGGARGDLFCRVVVETPVKLNGEQRELLRKFEESLQEGRQQTRAARREFLRRRETVLLERTDLKITTAAVAVPAVRGPRAAPPSPASASPTIVRLPSIDARAIRAALRPASRSLRKCTPHTMRCRANSSAALSSTRVALRHELRQQIGHRRSHRSHGRSGYERSPLHVVDARRRAAVRFRRGAAAGISSWRRARRGRCRLRRAAISDSQPRQIRRVFRVEAERARRSARPPSCGRRARLPLARAMRVRCSSSSSSSSARVCAESGAGGRRELRDELVRRSRQIVEDVVLPPPRRATAR